MGYLLNVIIVSCVVLFVIFIFKLVADLAKKKNRSAGSWVIFSLITTPILALIMLSILPAHETKEEKEIRIAKEKEVGSNSPTNKYNKFAATKPWMEA